MPITLNNSNISVTYNTGSNYVIETVKSDVFVKDTRTGISSNLFAEPSVIPSKTPVTTGNHKTLNFTNSITYDFTPYNDLTSWINYATSIGATTQLNAVGAATYGDGSWYVGGLGFINLPLNSSYNF